MLNIILKEKINKLKSLDYLYKNEMFQERNQKYFLQPLKYEMINTVRALEHNNKKNQCICD